MPGKKKKTKGSTLALNDFLGDFKAQGLTVLPTAPSGEEPGYGNKGGDRYGNRRDDRGGRGGRDEREQPPSAADQDNQWRRGGNNKGSSSGFGRRDEQRGGMSVFSTRNKYSNLDDNGGGDQRPAHLRRFGKSDDVRSTNTKQSSSLSSSNNNNNKKKEEQAQKLERKVVYSEDLVSETIDFKDSVTKFESCLVDCKELQSVDDLIEGLKRVNIMEEDPENVSAVLRKSWTSGNIPVKTLIKSIIKETNNEDDAALILARCFEATLTSKGEIYVREELKNENIMKIMKGKKSDEETDAFLKKHNIYFLKPVNENVLDNVISLCKNNSPPCDILKAIKNVVPDNVPVDQLLTAVADTCLNNVFIDAKLPDVTVFTKFAPLVQRVVFKSSSAEMNFVFAVQDKWFKSGADKSIILKIVTAMYESGCVSYEGFSAWREDTSNNTKGKLQMLLKVTSYLDDKKPVEEFDEEDDEEYDEGGEEEGDDDNY